MTAFVFLHGFAQTPRSWNTVALALQKAGHRTYALDLYGAGLVVSSADQSGPEAGEWGAPGDAPASEVAPALATVFASGIASALEGELSLGTMSEGAPCDSLASLAAVCDRVAATVRIVSAAEGAPVLVGYSMGGRIAAETLVRHPDLSLTAVLLEGAGLGPADEVGRAVLARRNRDWATRLRHEGVETFMDWWEALPLFASQRALPAETRAAVRVERVAHTADELARSLEAWGAHEQAAQGETLAALLRAQDAGVRVRYIAGSRDAKYAAVAEAVRAAGLPASLVEGAGHSVHLECPEAFLAIAASLG